MARLIVSTTKSPRFWITMIFFLLPLISTALVDSRADATAAAIAPAAAADLRESHWTPAPMDATTDGTIIVRKVAYPRDTADTFTFTGDVAGTIGNGGTLTMIRLPAPALYSSTETVPMGWDLNSIYCDDGSGSSGWTNTAYFDLQPEQTLQCTFYNQELGSEPCQNQVGTWPFGTSYAVEVDGTTAYLGSGSAFVTLDVSEPWNPQPLGSTWVEMPVKGIAVNNGYAFVTVNVGYDGALFAVDVNDPLNPQNLDSVLVDEPSGVDVDGFHVYVASGWAGITVVDVTNPADIQIVGSINTPGTAMDIEIRGDFGYIADGYQGFRVIDVSVPSNPTDVESLSLPGRANGLKIDGDYAYVASSDGLRLIYIGPGAPIHEVGFIATNYAWDVSIDGNHAFVADGSSGLKVIDVTVPTFLSLTDTVSLPGNSRQIVTTPGHAFIAAQNSNLLVVNTTTPSGSYVEGYYDFPGPAEDLAVIGDYAYLSLGYEGSLTVLDISDPAGPQQIDFSPAIFNVSVEPAGIYAYGSAGSLGLQVLDVSDPSSPSVLSTIDTQGYWLAAAAHQSLVFVADSHGTIHSIDAGNPMAPSYLGMSACAGTPSDIATDGTHAYVAAGSAGLRVFNVSNPPFVPLEVGSFDPPASITKVFLNGDLAYLGAGYSGLIVVDVSDPANPIEIGRYDTPGSIRDLVVSGRLVYYVSNGQRVSTIDIADPTAPIEIGTTIIPSTGMTIATSRGRVLVSEYEIGLEIFAPCGLLWADDFETGSTERWSLVVGGP